MQAPSLQVQGLHPWGAGAPCGAYHSTCSPPRACPLPVTPLACFPPASHASCLSTRCQSRHMLAAAEVQRVWVVVRTALV